MTATEQPRTGLQQQQPVTLGLPDARNDTAARDILAAGMLGDTMRLVGRTRVADDDFAHHALDGAANQRGERAGESLLVISGFYENAEHH